MSGLNLVLLAILLVAGVSAQWNPNFIPGRTTIVHLFEWRWEDIAAECTRYLGPHGFAGVQVSPPSENVIVKGDKNRPWWERYQPVSYKLETRSGTEEEFKEMVTTCNGVGVRIYVDAVINHMSGQGAGEGTAGSKYDTLGRSYEGVPFNSSDFNGKPKCPTPSGDIEDYHNAIQVRNCKLSGLNDLDQSRPHVREVIQEYLNRLTSYGVAGFRIDASKHMWPNDIKSILAELNDLPTDQGFPEGSKPLIFQEVIDLGGEPITAAQYTGNGRVTEFKYGKFMGEIFRKQNYQQLSYLRNFGEGWGFLKDNNSLAFVDNHDNQRGHGAGGASILTFRVPRLYKQAVAFMLAWPYGVTRVMSSYYWEQKMEGGKDLNDFIGPPHDADENILPVPINETGSCGDGWICEHRWGEITQMVQFRNMVQGTAVANWWDNGKNQIAFSRGNKGFIAINNDDFDLSAYLQTGLPSGAYCDIISGGIEDEACVGDVIVVDRRGKVSIYISKDAESPIVAIHADAKLGFNPYRG